MEQCIYESIHVRSSWNIYAREKQHRVNCDATGFLSTLDVEDVRVLFCFQWKQSHLFGKI